MLQNLLVERFKLNSHRERKELPAYDLVLAKGGPKLKKADDGPVSRDDSDIHTGNSLTKYTMGKDGFPVLQLEPGATSGTAMGWNGRVTDWIGRITITQFAEYLSAHTGRQVTNRTGLTGRYDITLRFLYDQGLNAETADAQETAPAYEVFDAIQFELGLRLDSTRAMLEVLVIDHVERVPVENQTVAGSPAIRGGARPGQNSP